MSHVNESGVLNEIEPELTISGIINNSIINYKTPNDNRMLRFKNPNNTIFSQWIPDHLINSCQKCSSNFTLTSRKHHCRNCGGIFCGVCSNFWIEIPDYIQSVNNESNYYHYRTYLEILDSNFNIFKEKKKRVCQSCFTKILEIGDLKKTMNLFDTLPLTIKDYREMAKVNRSWNKIAKYYFSFFREIQYYLPDHKYTEKEKSILWNNREFFIGHSKWITQFIISFDWEKRERKHVMELFFGKSQEKLCMCDNLGCDDSCSNELLLDDLILILSKKITYFPLVKIILEKFEQFPVKKMINYLFTLVNIMYFYRVYSDIAKFYEKILLEKAKSHIGFANLLFWEITSRLSSPDSQKYFSEFRKKLIGQLDKNTARLFQNGYDFTINLNQIITNNENPLEPIKVHLYTHSFSDKQNFSLPIDMEKKFLGIDIENIRGIISKTKPIILPCKYSLLEDTPTELCQIFNIMIKKEDIRKEAIIMNVIKIMNEIIIDELGIDLGIKTYNILPISNECGYIEFVRDAITLYSIREDKKQTIQNYIFEENPNMTIKDFRSNFIGSCAGYCVITYLLGIGDRHLDNIMITKNGYIFHIDFGYILGQDPKPLAPEIRLTVEMVDAMGGINSKHFQEFKILVGKVYNCLRRHTPIFYSLLLGLCNVIPKIDNGIYTEELVKNHVLQRFIPWESDDNANKRLQYKLEENFNTYSESVIDYFHKQNKGKSSSFSDPKSTIDNLIGSLKGWFS